MKLIPTTPKVSFHFTYLVCITFFFACDNTLNYESHDQPELIVTQFSGANRSIIFRKTIDVTEINSFENALTIPISYSGEEDLRIKVAGNNNGKQLFYIFHQTQPDRFYSRAISVSLSGSLFIEEALSNPDINYIGDLTLFFINDEFTPSDEVTVTLTGTDYVNEVIVDPETHTESFSAEFEFSLSLIENQIDYSGENEISVLFECKYNRTNYIPFYVSETKSNYPIGDIDAIRSRMQPQLASDCSFIRSAFLRWDSARMKDDSVFYIKDTDLIFRWYWVDFNNF